MKVDESSVLAVMNPFSLLAGGALVCLVAWICVYLFRNTNDFRKSLIVYVPVLCVLDCAFIFLLGIDLILVLGLDLCGIVVLALISNHYFYH